MMLPNSLYSNSYYFLNIIIIIVIRILIFIIIIFLLPAVIAFVLFLWRAATYY